MSVRERCSIARDAAIIMAGLRTEQKNAVLSALATSLRNHASRIFEANKRDVKQATIDQVPPPLLKRLVFDQKKLDEVLGGLRSLIDLPDPVGSVLLSTELDKGLELYRVSCPIGLVAMIFESRPDALVQMAGLAVKSGNGLVLKGGKEALETNRVLAGVIHDAAVTAGFPQGWLVLLETREETREILGLHDLIDLIIPRGSNEFVQYIMKNSLIPVMGHADGVCHAYVSRSADPELAETLVFDSKTQYVAACNALETVLVDSSVAGTIVPRLARKLAEKQVAIHGCPRTRALIDCLPMDNDAWNIEYLDYAVSMKVVDGLEDAIRHINTWGSRHTELYIGTDAAEARHFMERVDAAGVYWNASTRFADGFRYGLGAEVGISTGKLHARGPVGLEGLVTYKYKLFGSGNIVADYAEGRRHFAHRNLDVHKEPWK